MKALRQYGRYVFMALMLLVPALPVPEFWITLGNYIGLYASAYLSTTLGYSPWLGLLVGLGITIMAAITIGGITMRLSGHYLPLGTIAWGLSLFYLFGNTEMLGKYDGLNGIPVICIFGMTLDSGRAMFALIWVILFLCLIV